MKSSDRSILIGIAVLGLLAAFWFLVLTPKREEAAELDQEVGALEASVAEQEQLAAAGAAAETDFDTNYKSLVVLGKAVPSEDDTSSLFVQLNELSHRSDVRLSTIELTPGATTAAPAPEPTPPATTEAQTESGELASEPPAPAAAPTEAAASTLPLGATVGPAGLPVMPYKLELDGSFFELAEFMKGIDDLIGFKDGKPAVHGRLLTVDGFSLAPDEALGLPELDATLSLTSYVSPADEGVTAGASPAGPAPATSTTVGTTTEP